MGGGGELLDVVVGNEQTRTRFYVRGEDNRRLVGPDLLDGLLDRVRTELWLRLLARRRGAFLRLCLAEMALTFQSQVASLTPFTHTLQHHMATSFQALLPPTLRTMSSAPPLHLSKPQHCQMSVQRKLK